ncbi:hypothetical protein D3C80_1753470 [compost metagenome]
MKLIPNERLLSAVATAAAVGDDMIVHLSENSHEIQSSEVRAMLFCYRGVADVGL